MDNLTLLFVATFLTAVLGIVVGVIAFSYRKLVSKYDSLRTQVGEKDKMAQVQANQIIEEAKLKADVILKGSENYQELLKKDLQKQIQIAGDSYQKAYQTILNTLQIESTKTIENISNDIKLEINSEVKNVLGNLEKELISSQESAIDELKQGLAKSKEEVRLYKEEMYKKIDQSILQIIQAVSYRVIGKSISLQDHEELVLNALINAKRRGII